MADWRTTKIEEPKVEFPSVFNAVDTITQEKINNLPAENLKKAKNAKYALEEIQTKKFYETLKSYYTWRDGDSELTTKGIKTFSEMNHEEMLEFFYNDRAWRNNNTIAMGKDMANVFGIEDPEKLKQFAYIQETYAMLPSFWNDPNVTWADFLINSGGAMVADPVNLIGFGVGGQAAKQGYKTALKELLKGRMAKELNKKQLLEMQKRVQKEAMGKAIKKGALYEGFIGGTFAGSHDAMLQTTAIQSGISDEFSLKQLGLSTAAGFGFGTVFGAGFTAGSFKLTNRSLKNTSIKQLNDLHNYGRGDITGKRLFTDLAEKKKKKFYYKNLSKEKIDEIEANSRVKGNTTEERILNLRKTADEGIRSDDKPPKEKFNYTKFKSGKALIFLKASARQIADELGSDRVSFKDMERVAEELSIDPVKLRKLALSKSKEDRELYGLIIAHGDSMIKEADDIVKLANELQRVDLSPDERAAIKTEIQLREEVLAELMSVQKSMQENYARATTAGRVIKDKERAVKLIIEPEDPKMKQLKEGDSDAYYEAISKLDDNNHVILALQNSRKVNKWDLAAEYVNNNLLSSPDTHILNIISGLTQTQWKPFVMLLRSARLLTKDRSRAKIVAREALMTWTYQAVFTKHALARALKSFYMGRPVLDSVQMKYDSNIRQGQLQQFINGVGEMLTEPFGMLGKPVQKAINVAAYTTSLPMRVLSAGDEFLKTMLFKGRMAAQINSNMMRLHPEILSSSFDTKRWTNRKAYIDKFREMEAEYVANKGEGIGTPDMKSKNLSDADRLEVNDPLQYAREGSYTQSATSINPLTGNKEGRITGWLLSTTKKAKWLRVIGLHFINTPSNLLRWNFQHFPFLGRFQFQMKHMLAKGKDGKFLNPEAAAEAQARMDAGLLLWGSAVTAVLSGKITGGGSRDYKVNKEKQELTNWKPYAWVQNDGTHVSINRLDPIFMPFFVVADVVDGMKQFMEVNEDLPESVANQYLELGMATVAMITRNLTSKFYTRNILETANALLSDDFMAARSPDRVFSSILARAMFKIVPLSGGLRYLDRVGDEWQRELLTFTDRMRTLDPFDFISNQDYIMPKRNMLGEIIKRDNGWLFGLGGDTGLWSSPFAMQKWKNNATVQFFENRDIEYREPNKKDKYTQLDLRDVRHPETGQTAYDRMLEIKTEIKIPYKGKKYSLPDLIEILIADKKSNLYKLPSGEVAGVDYQQKKILSIITNAERVAYNRMFKEFPILKETMKLRNIFIKEKFNEAKIQWNLE